MRIKTMIAAATITGLTACAPSSTPVAPDAATTAICGHLESGQAFGTRAAFNVGWDCNNGGPYAVLDFSCGKAILWPLFWDDTKVCASIYDVSAAYPLGAAFIIGPIAMVNHAEGDQVITVLGP